MTMTPDQFRHFLEDNRKSTAEAIHETVNGKIDAINNKLDTHIKTHDEFLQEVMPVLKAFQGGKMLGEAMKWLAGIAAAYLVIKGLWK